MFERDDMVSREDLYRCAKAMGGWSQQDGKFSEALILFFSVERLMSELDPNHEGDVNEEEFLLILKFI